MLPVGSMDVVKKEAVDGCFFGMKYWFGGILGDWCLDFVVCCLCVVANECLLSRHAAICLLSGFNVN